MDISSEHRMLKDFYLLLNSIIVTEQHFKNLFLFCHLDQNGIDFTRQVSNIIFLVIHSLKEEFVLFSM